MIEKYNRYCQSQAAYLLQIVPRDSVRPLYRKARKWGISNGIHDTKDPMATLYCFCRALLLLPSFEGWLEDYSSHSLDYLKANSMSQQPSYAIEPSEWVTVESRVIEYGGDRWHAHLDVYRGNDLWKGHIRFHRENDNIQLKTCAIFFDDETRDLRGSFCSLTFNTLTDFLRSVLP